MASLNRVLSFMAFFSLVYRVCVVEHVVGRTGIWDYICVNVGIVDFRRHWVLSAGLFGKNK